MTKRTDGIVSRLADAIDGNDKKAGKAAIIEAASLVLETFERLAISFERIADTLEEDMIRRSR